MELNDTAILRKPSGAIHISNSFSLLEQKLFNTLMYDFQHQKPLPSGEYEISDADIRVAVGWERSHNTDQLKTALRKLVGTTVEWNETAVDKSTTWAVCTFLASARVMEKGKVRYRPNPEIVDQLDRPRIFARMQLLIQGRIGRRYSLILYEYLLDHICRDKRQPQRLVVEDVQLEFLKRLFGITRESAETYFKPDGYKHFRQQVLKPAIKEISEKTDLTVEMAPCRKESRRIISLSFDIQRKDSFQLVFDLDQDKPQQEVNKDLVAQLREHGVGERQSVEICRKFDRERIEGNIQYMFEEIKKGRDIRRRGAWLYTAIREDHRPQVSPAEKQAADEKAARVDASKKAYQSMERKEQLEKEFSSFQYQRARERLAAASKTFQTRRRNEFVRQIKANEHPGLSMFWRSQGWDSPAVESVFLGQLVRDAKFMTEAYERNFDAYVLWKANDPTQTVKRVATA